MGVLLRLYCPCDLQIAIAGSYTTCHHVSSPMECVPLKHSLRKIVGNLVYVTISSHISICNMLIMFITTTIILIIEAKYKYVFSHYIKRANVRFLSSDLIKTSDFVIYFLKWVVSQ